MSALLKTQTEAERLSGSVQACARLRQNPIWRRASQILFYAPRADEIDLWPLAQEALAEGKTVVLPRYDSAQRSYVGVQVKNLERDVDVGHFGIREPHTLDCIFPLIQLDLALVPGVAFDVGGCRLGRGKGYYDRLLATVRGTKCGVAWDFQIQARIPAEFHDLKLQCILTPTRWLVAGQSWSGNDFTSK